MLLSIVATANAPDAALQAAAQQENVERFRAYHDRLVSVSRGLAARTSLVDVVRPIFVLAGERGNTGNAADENRAALMALALYVNGWPATLLVPDAQDWPRPAPRTLVLGGRHDLAQHFIVSSLITAAGGTPLAAAAGLYKELSDARDGSGFSFSDLAADKAGEAFGALATASDSSARRLQVRISTSLREDDLMPAIDGLVDNLSETEFVRQFGGLGSPAYQAVIDDISRRVAALPIFD